MKKQGIKNGPSEEELARMEESYSDYELENPEFSEVKENETQPEEEEPEEINPIEKFFEEAGEGIVYNGKNNELKFYVYAD